MKPASLFDRDREWSRLAEFVESALDSCLLGLVYGRRRQGKTTLLRHLCETYRGFYWQATETEAADNLDSLSAAWARWTDARGPIRFASWGEAVESVTAPTDRPTPVVLDEIGRVIGKVPSLPSLIQRALDSVRPGSSGNHTRLILCGSAFGQMRRLLDGSAPLRGRAALELVVQPFDFRTAARFWQVDTNPTKAFDLFSLVGGTPAYPVLAAGDLPRVGGIDRWVVRRLLDPSSSLFREGRIVVAEDSELSDQQLYWGLLGAVATGRRRWTDIDELLGAKKGSLSHALNRVIDAGWLARREDPLRANRATYELREPLVRFHRLVTEPHEDALRLGVDPQRVWHEVEPVVASLIHGPQLEQLVYDWSQLYADAATFGGTVSAVGPTEVDGRQIDLAAVERTARGAKRLLALGEVKALSTRVGVDLLDRLDRASAAAAVRPPRDVRVGPEVRKVIVSRSGFTNDLRRAADRRSDVVLVDLERLYHGT